MEMSYSLSKLVGSLKNFLKYRIIGDTIVIDASSFCQLKCELCPRDLYAEKVGLGYLKLSDFVKFVDSSPGIKNIELAHTGEMFLNPELIDIIKYGHIKNINLTAFNGVNFNNVSDEILECLVKYQFKGIRIAIDGASNETYEKYRKGGNFDRVVENINKLNFFKRKYGSMFPHLVWAFIIFGHNEHEIPYAKNMSKELNMTFLPVFNCHPSYSPIKNNEIVAREIGLSTKNFECKLNNAYSDVCMQLWQGPYINWDGRLLGCCINEWGDYGNVFRDGLKKCLKSEKYIYAKKMLLGKVKARDDIPCFYCDKYKSISFQNKITKNKIEKLRLLKLPFLILERYMLVQCIFSKAKEILDFGKRDVV